MWIKIKDRNYLNLDLQNEMRSSGGKKPPKPPGNNSGFAFPHEHFSCIE